MTSWITYGPENLSRLPNTAGVYVIYYGDDLVYVGQSERLKDRLEHHEKLSAAVRPSSRVKVKLCKRLGESRMVEFRLLTRLRPSLNKAKALQKEFASPHMRSKIIDMLEAGATPAMVSRELNRLKEKDLLGRVWTPVSVRIVAKQHMLLQAT